MGAPTWPTSPQPSTRPGGAVAGLFNRRTSSARETPSGVGLAADELLHDRVHRPLNDRRWSHLDDAALVQHGHGVGDLEDLGDLVAHHHRGEVMAPVQLDDEPVDAV